MTKKKQQHISISQNDEAQAQATLNQIHKVVQAIHRSDDQKAAEDALASITAMTETGQLALVKALGKMQHSDAADVLVAINAFAPLKEVRKEARRSLIRLEGVKVYPQWLAPVGQAPIFSIQQTVNPPRFWKGLVTQTRDAGEVQLLLLWEQGEGYREVRVLGFLLEFWSEGVKDFFTYIETKRSVEKLIDQTVAGVPLANCTLAKGRSLIREALAVNKKIGLKPHRDYTNHLALINQMVMEAPDIEEEDEDNADSLILPPDLSPELVVANFVLANADGDFELAYAYLASNSDLKEGLPQKAWVARRRSWFEEVTPTRFDEGLIHECEPRKSALWLPNPFNRTSTTKATNKEVEVSWSIEFSEPLDSDSAPPELPAPTTVYEETGRHWFWSKYTLVEEEHTGWRIQSTTDEGQESQNLPISELQRRIDENLKQIAQIEVKGLPTDATLRNEWIWRLWQTLNYEEALLLKSPQNHEMYRQAAAHAAELEDTERQIVLFERKAEHFPMEREQILLIIASAQMQVSVDYEDYVDEEELDNTGFRMQRFQYLAETNVRESLSMNDSLLGHYLLAKILMVKGSDENLTEAKEHLMLAKAMPAAPPDQATIERELGKLADLEDQPDVALSHFQQAVELNPKSSDLRVDLGKAYYKQGKLVEAEQALKPIVEQEPNNMDALGELVAIYTTQNRMQDARKLLEKGLQLDPDSPVLLVFLAQTYMKDDPKRAEKLLDKAEKNDPTALVVPMFRQYLASLKDEQSIPTQLQLPNQRRKKK